MDVDASVCGIHAVDTRAGTVLGSLIWPLGNQVFAIEWLPGSVTSGFPFSPGGGRGTSRARELFYSFVTANQRKRNS
jgi:hypothetical protein